MNSNINSGYGRSPAGFYGNNIGSNTIPSGFRTGGYQQQPAGGSAMAMRSQQPLMMGMRGGANTFRGSRMMDIPFAGNRGGRGGAPPGIRREYEGGHQTSRFHEDHRVRNSLTPNGQPRMQQRPAEDVHRLPP
jgi:hypothetical protein